MPLVLEPRILRRPNLAVKSEMVRISTGLVYLCSSVGIVTVGQQSILMVCDGGPNTGETFWKMNCICNEMNFTLNSNNPSNVVTDRRRWLHCSLRIDFNNGNSAPQGPKQRSDGDSGERKDQ